MPISLDDLANTPIVTDALGATDAATALRELVAEPGFAPRAWQSAAPDTSYQSTKMPVQDSEDLQRIKALPRRAPVLPDSREAELLVQVVTNRYARKRTTRCDCAGIRERYDLPPDPCITRLNTTQAWALYELHVYGGLLGPIGVGHGKTILDLLSPLAVRGCRKAVLLVPPNLVVQLIQEYELLREHFVVPSMIVWGDVKLPGDVQRRPYNAIAPEPDAPTIHVYPYSRLSRPESTVKLEEIGADLIVADEAHKLRHADTATTARVLRYLDKHGASVRGAAWSGSLSDASLKDYAHLAAMALREMSPLPLEPETVEDWARAIDPKLGKRDDGNDYNNPWSAAAPPGALFQLDDGRGGHITEVFHRRLVETPGVVSTRAPAIDAELSIVEQHPNVDEIPEPVEDALDKLRDTWCRPDGEQLVDALSVARCARELACGFFYRWTFPRGEPVSLILEWLEIRKLYRSELRWKLAQRREYLDSPYLCELAAKRHHGDVAIPPCPHDKDPREWALKHPMWESEFWPAWRDIRGQVQPETEAVRLDDYLARDAAEWAIANRGIVWYDSNEFGEWVAELSGLTKHGGGPNAGSMLMTELKHTRGQRSVVCSIHSHGTGRNGLQSYFHDQLVAQPPSSPSKWEQLLGRLHRIGQLSPIVYARFYRHTPELADHVDKALARALYVQTTLGSAQKLRTGFKLPEPTPVTADELDLDALAVGALDDGADVE